MSIEIILLLTIGAGLALGFIVMPFVLKICRRYMLYDAPNKRKVHKNPVPRLGGISFFPCAFVAMSTMLASTTLSSETFTVSVWTVLFGVCLLAIYMLGVIDDLIGLEASLKFVVQIIAATTLVSCGVCIHDFHGVFGLYEVPALVAYPFTIMLTVFICNAINLIDGIDGLSSGLAIIALGGFMVIFTSCRLVYYALMIAAIIGVLMAFLRHNVFGSAERGTKMFMGDSGSLSIGFILAFLFIKVWTMPESDVNDGMIACSLVAVPVFDVIRVIIVRIRNHKPVFGADKNHIHHKLMAAGCTQHVALAWILALSLVIIGVTYTLLGTIDINAIIAIDVAIWLLFNIVVNSFIKTTNV